VNGLLAFLQQAVGWLGGQARQAWNVASAVAAGHTAPARQVALYTLVLLALLLLAPRILKKLTK
jgi:hypothetical protein